MLVPNTVLQKRYRVVRELKHGGMGTIYEAIDQRVNCLVALKEALGRNGSRTNSFEREAALLANLRHQSLPKVMDYFSEDDGYFLVMEYIPGYDLEELLQLRGAPFPQSRVLRWADEVLGVLGYLHGRQPPILHRDIKPSNLKLTKRRELFLLDFGLAKGAVGQMSTLANTGSVHGYTQRYASLEQMFPHGGTDVRSDLYSLGATLYHLFTAVAPVAASTRFDKLEDGETDPLPPICELNPQVSTNVASVVAQAMAMSRKYRWSSAAEMRKALFDAAEEDERTSMEEEFRRADETRLSREVASHQGNKERAQGDKERAKPIKKYSIDFSEADTTKMHISRRPRKASDGEKAESIILVSQPDVSQPRTKEAGQLANRAKRKPADGPSRPAKPRASVKKAPKAGGPSPESIKTPPDSSQTLDATVSARVHRLKLSDLVTMELVEISPGRFQMGSKNGEADEKPVHVVNIRDRFYMGRCQVTQAQWQAVIGNNPSNFRGDSLPVENVSWFDIQRFIKKINDANHEFLYRLPTEAEWEYACRAGSESEYSGNLDAMAWYAENSSNTTHPVGTKEANGFGLFDMHGNVWEWCEDVYHENYQGAPSDGTAWLLGGDQNSRVLRGGAWLNDASSLRSSDRDQCTPDYRLLDLGFRIVGVPKS
jgi:formylglycine-generating enzyme required for sulfatase activity